MRVHRLSDVNELGRSLTDGVNSEEFQAFGIEEEFEHAVGVPQDLPAGNFAIACEADLVRNALRREFLLGRSDHGNLGDGVDTEGKFAGALARRDATGMAGGAAPLLARGRGERGEADDVARGVDMRNGRTVEGVDFEASSVVGLDARDLEVEPVGVALAADAVEEAVAGDLLVARGVGDDEVAASLEIDHLLPEAKLDVAVLHVESKDFDDLTVDELEHAVVVVDEGDAYAEGREDTGVLDADHAGPDDGQSLRESFEVEDLVGVEDALAVEVEPRRPRGPGTGREEKLLGLDESNSIFTFDDDPVGTHEGTVSAQDLDAVPEELGLEDLRLVADDLVRALQEILDGDVALDSVVLPVERLLVEPGEVERRLP